MAPRTKKSLEERIAILDQKIERKRSELASLEAERERIMHPISMRAVLTKAKKLGMSPAEVAEKLGIDMHEDDVSE